MWEKPVQVATVGATEKRGRRSSGTVTTSAAGLVTSGRRQERQTAQSQLTQGNGRDSGDGTAASGTPAAGGPAPVGSAAT